MERASEDLFWYWINERHKIYLKKTQGMPKPWTADPILQQYKFTNVFRQLDAGTVWLTENFIKPHWDAPLDLLVFNVCWYRMFNWKGTGEALGWQWKWNETRIKRILAEMVKNKKQVFTGAHIIHSEPGEAKADSIVDVCTQIWENRLEVVFVASASRTLRATFEILQTHRHVGGFMAYEMVSDLRHTRVLDNATDIMTWANLGPGALRGLRRLDPDARPAEGVERMKDLLDRSPAHLEPVVPPLEMRDIEHSLCEFDKYCRVHFHEGKPRSTYPGRA